MARGQTDTTIAESTGYTRGWIGQVAKRYNQQVPVGMVNRQHMTSWRVPRMLTAEQQEELRAARAGPAPPTPGPSVSTSCSNCGHCVAGPQWPQLTVHDSGMRAALARLDETSVQSMQLAWSPDGKHLAVASGEVGAGAPALSVYDCTSGGVRLQLSRADIVPGQASGQPFSVLAWSPDGTHLLLVLLLVPVVQGSLIRVLGPTSLDS